MHIKKAEKTLENFHYVLAKAKLEKRMIIRNGDSEKEALWNQRWGKASLKLDLPEDNGEKKEEMSGRGNSKAEERRAKAAERMKILRSSYNHVHHQCGIHSVANVDESKGAQLAARKDKKKSDQPWGYLR